MKHCHKYIYFIYQLVSYWYYYIESARNGANIFVVFFFSELTLLQYLYGLAYKGEQSVK